MSADLDCQWGGDLSFAATGDLVTISQSDRIRQRLVRRLLTVLQGYIWQPLYGAGLPERVGTIVSTDELQGIVAGQAAMETGIDQTQPITVTVVSDALGDTSVSISYIDAQDGTVQTALVPIS